MCTWFRRFALPEKLSGVAHPAVPIRGNDVCTMNASLTLSARDVFRTCSRRGQWLPSYGACRCSQYPGQQTKHTIAVLRIVSAANNDPTTVRKGPFVPLIIRTTRSPNRCIAPHVSSHHWTGGLRTQAFGVPLRDRAAHRILRDQRSAQTRSKGKQCLVLHVV